MTTPIRHRGLAAPFDKTDRSVNLNPQPYKEQT